MATEKGMTIANYAKSKIGCAYIYGGYGEKKCTPSFRKERAGQYPEIAGVLVADPQRLSRGSLSDCDRLILSFQYTGTLILTPMMRYDLTKKYERRFFQDELLRGRDYLDYVKETLWRGRINAIRRGCYISAQPPHGYNRIKIGRDWTLEPNDDADMVRLMFDWYVKEDMTPGAIARRLNAMGHKTTNGREWSRNSVRAILLNIHYTGKVRFNFRKAILSIENGERILRHVIQTGEDVIIAEGKHPAIVDQDMYDAAQNKLSANPRVKDKYGLVNVLSGVLRCAKCGRVMMRDPKQGATPRYLCRHRPQCYKSAKAPDIEQAIIVALEQAELPKLRAKLANGDGEAAAIQKRRIDKLVKQMKEYRAQEDKQYELLETGKYTQEVFDRRNASLREKMEECEKEMYLARSAMPKNVDYGERIVTLEKAIEALKDETVPTETRNRLLRAIVDRIEYSATDGGLNKTDIRLEVFLKL